MPAYDRNFLGSERSIDIPNNFLDEKVLSILRHEYSQNYTGKDMIFLIDSLGENEYEFICNDETYVSLSYKNQRRDLTLKYIKVEISKRNFIN